MNLSVRRSHNLRGKVDIPSNKSHSFRALLLAALAEGESHIHGPMTSADWMRGAEAMEMFGAEVTPETGGAWRVRGVGGKLKTPGDVIDCGNSGIIFRFFTAISACCPGYTVLTGDESIREIRPVQSLLSSLEQLGAFAVSSRGEGFAPVIVRGPMLGGRAEMDGQDSQPISALLIASALAEAPTELTVSNPGEKPWIDMTTQWLSRCGVELVNQDYSRYLIRGSQLWQGFETWIPKDWSAAMYPIVAALITADSEIHLPGMDFNDCQGDRLVVNILREMGGDIQVDENGVTACSSSLKGMEIDCNDFIDQFMLLAVVGCFAEGETILRNAAICRQKECDRISAMYHALRSMGADVEELPDGLKVRKSLLAGTRLDSRNDHRMVMTLATAALAASGETLITNIECVRKTFPHFVQEMEHTGAVMISC